MVIAVLFLSGCDSRASRAAKAFDAYQTATAAGNLRAARSALLKLVAAKEDVPGYWMELGKVQLQLQNYPKAYYAFTRASELNRGDPEPLRYMIQISLQSGQLADAEEQAKQLDLLAPGDPGIKMTTGLVALRRQDFEGAGREADAILAVSPTDSNANILKARSLLGLGKKAEATAWLVQQVTRQPDDGGSIRALIDFYRADKNWAEVTKLAPRFRKLAPEDESTALLLVEAGFRSGDPALARSISAALLKPDAPTDLVEQIFAIWRTEWRGDGAISAARQIGGGAPLSQKVVIARFLIDRGAPAAAAELVQFVAKQRPSPANVDARGAYYYALARMGRRDEARAGLEKILASDPDNALSLAAFAPLVLSYGETRRALDEARRLVTVEPARADNRLILAKCYDAVGDRDAARRTLWEAFHDLPGQETIYTSLRAYLGPQSDEAKRLDVEYADQLQRKLTQEQV